MLKKIMMGIFLASIYAVSSFSESAASVPQAAIESLKELITKKIVGDQKMKEDLAKDKTLFDQERNTNLQSHGSLAPFIDFEHIGAVAMPKKWQDKFWTSKSDKKAFMEIFQDLVEEIVYPKAKDFFDKHALKYKKTKTKEGFQDLYYVVEIQKKSGEIEKIDLMFRLQNKQSSWKICDIRLDKELWTDMFKNQFNHIISTKSYETLIQKMKDKLKRVQAGEAY